MITVHHQVHVDFLITLYNDFTGNYILMFQQEKKKLAVTAGLTA
jgi:hypothetical protein